MKLILTATPNEYCMEYKIMYDAISFEDESCILFHFNSNRHVYKSISQLDPIKNEIIDLCFDLYGSEKSNISWENDILPIIRNHKICNIIDQIIK